MMWAIGNLTGGNRVSRAILLRYSAVPLAENELGTQSTGSQAMASTTSTVTSANSARGGGGVAAAVMAMPLSSVQPQQQQMRGKHYPGSAVPKHATSTTITTTGSSSSTGSLQLPLDVEETVTCFCRYSK